MPSAPPANWRVGLGTGLIVALGILGVFGTTLLNADPRQIGLAPRLAPPSTDWWFGTDPLSRALLPRVLDGIRATFVLSVTAVVATTLIGTSLGLLAGYVGGLVDQVIGRAADVLFAFPAILLALLVSAVLGFGAASTILSIVFVALPLMVRVVRAATLILAKREFVEAAKVVGASPARVLLIHLLPNVSGALAVQVSYACGAAMLIEGGLSFLGLGVQPPESSLGSLVREGSAYLSIAPWLSIAPGTVLGLAIIAVNLVGDGLRDHMDPLQPRRLQ
jgi:peptide/nickel transport system permease protein